MIVDHKLSPFYQQIVYLFVACTIENCNVNSASLLEMYQSIHTDKS